MRCHAYHRQQIDFFLPGKQTFHVWLRNVLFGDRCSIIKCRKSQKHSCHLLAPLLTTFGGLRGKAGQVFGRIHQAWGQLCSTRDWSQILSHAQPPSMERRWKRKQACKYSFSTGVSIAMLRAPGIVAGAAGELCPHPACCKMPLTSGLLAGQQLV